MVVLLSANRQASARRRAVALGFVAVLASVVVSLSVARQGIGVSRDSAVYLGAAQNLLDRKGLTVPFRAYPVRSSADPLATQERLENFPPLYPVLLAGLSRVTGADVTTAARVVNVVALAGLVLLVGWVVWVSGRGRLWPAALAVALMLMSVDVLIAASMAWSELLFTVLVVAALVVLARQLEAPSRVWLGVCAALLALAFLTRFAGAAAVAAAGASVLLFAARPWAQRLREAAALVVAGSLPALVWTVATATSGDRVGNRELSFHPIGARALSRGSETLMAWLLPGPASARLLGGPGGDVVQAVADLPHVVRALVVLATVAGLVVLTRRAPRPGREAAPPLPVLPKVMAVFVGSYLGFLVVAMSVLDASLARLDHRLLMPAHVAALLAVATLMARLVAAPASEGRPSEGSATRAPPAPALAVLLVAAPLALLLVVHGALLVADGDQFGGLYSGERWQRSPIMAAVRSIPPERPMVTNEPNAVWAVTGRSAATLPEQRNLLTLRDNGRLDTELAELARAMQARGALLVYVDGGREAAFAPSEATLQARLGLRLVRREADGAVYEVGPPGG